jgi:hypothetical protein
MEEEYDLGDLEYIKSGGPSDEEMDKIDGIRVKIDSINIIEATSRFQDGKPLPEGMEIKVKKLELTTVPFGASLIGRDIVHKERYNLKDKSGKWIVSLHEKASTAKFLATYKLDKFENAKGKEVLLIKKTNPDTKRSYLTIKI